MQEAGLSRPPFLAPRTPHSAQAKAVLRLWLSCRDESLTFAGLSISSVRFFLKGQPQYIIASTSDPQQHHRGGLANGPDDDVPVVLDPDCLRQVGFELDEGLLPYSPRSFLGYRLLTEYFAFAEKSLFVDLKLSDPPHRGSRSSVRQPVGNLPLSQSDRERPGG